jgi:hypothetical protein
VHDVTKGEDKAALDWEKLRLGIERCDADLLIGFYAEDARLSIVNAAAPLALPFELRGKGEIAKHLRVAFGPEASHRVGRDATVGEERVTFREACEYQDGDRVWVETTLEVHDGKIVRQVDVVASDAGTTRQEGGGRGPPPS